MAATLLPTWNMRGLLALLALSISIAAANPEAHAASSYPPLRDGDLIFQTSKSKQSAAILLATGDRFSHMGIIKHVGKEIVVIEAAGQVKETPLHAWAGRGLFGRVAIYRSSELTPEMAQGVIDSAKTLYGKPYDIFFSFNNDAIYCSELPYLAYKAAGLSIGKIERLSELNFDNALVRRLIRQRWQRHEECVAAKFDFEGCYRYVLSQELVTPASIAKGAGFKQIYSDYPF